MKTKSELPRFPKLDKRLLGTWKSDRYRTFKEWNWKKRTPSKKKAILKKLFGNLEITYARSKVISRLPHRNWEYTQRYWVVASDDESVAVILHGKMEIKDRRKYDPFNLKLVEQFFDSMPKIRHIHFEKKHCWISLGNGRNREFFKKIRP